MKNKNAAGWSLKILVKLQCLHPPKSDDKNVEEMFTKCSTAQSFIWTEMTTYRIGTLVNIWCRNLSIKFTVHLVLQIENDAILQPNQHFFSVCNFSLNWINDLIIFVVKRVVNAPSQNYYWAWCPSFLNSVYFVGRRWQGPRIIPCLAELELWLPDNNSFAATKDKFGSFLKKLFNFSTSHIYHHNSSWTIR